MRVLLIVSLLFISIQSEANMFVNEKIIMSKENAKDVECSAFSLGIMSGAKEELLGCVSKHIKKGYSINESKTTSNIEQLKVELAKFEQQNNED